MAPYVLVPENIFKLYFKKYRRNKRNQVIGIINRPNKDSKIAKTITKICKNKKRKRILTPVVSSEEQYDFCNYFDIIKIINIIKFH